MSENLGRVAKKINFAQRENKKWEISEPKRKSFFFPEFIFAKTGLLSQPTTGPRKTTFYEIIKIFFTKKIYGEIAAAAGVAAAGAGAGRGLQPE